jgi:uncharacterized tellurite resistance protein B-like protein
MLNRILAFFESEQSEPESLTVDESAAVLLIEVMMADHELDPRERKCIANILSERMNVSESEIDSCIEKAMQRQNETHDLFQFTRIINDQYDENQRYLLLVDLWKVAFADEDLDKHEDHRIRRVSDMMHLHHSHFIRAKQEAQKI